MNRFTLILAAIILFSSCLKDDDDNTKNHLPHAVFALSPLRAEINTPVQFDAGAVADVEDPSESLEVQWSFAGNNEYTTYTTAKTAVHTYTNIGFYLPKLRVRDLQGLVDSTHNMVVIVNDLANMPPTIPLLVSPPEWQTWMEPTIIFKWRSGTDPEDDSLSFDLWIGQSLATMKLFRSDIDYFTMIGGEKVYETTESGFQYEQDYYWQVGAKDPNGNYTLGHTWKFTTRPQ